MASNEYDRRDVPVIKSVNRVTKIYRLSLIILLLSVFFSCDKENNAPPLVDLNIDRNYLIHPWEFFSNGQRLFGLRLATYQPLPCLNVQQEYEIEEVQNGFELLLQPLQPPSDCEEGESNLVEWIPIAELSNDEYELQIRLADEINSLVKIQNDLGIIRVQLLEANGLALANESIMRIPEDLSWGYIEVLDENFRGQANSLAVDLSALGDDEKLNTGNYGYFEIDAADGVTIPALISQKPTIPVIIPNSGDDLAAVREKIEERRRLSYVADEQR